MISLGSPEYPEYLKEIIHSIQYEEPDIVIDTIGSTWSLETSFNVSSRHYHDNFWCIIPPIKE